MLLGTFFIDRLKRGNFPAERKVDSRHFHPSLILSEKQRNKPICTITSYIAAPLGKPYNDDEANTHPIPILRQMVLKPCSAHCELVTTTASNINTVEPKVFK